MSRTICAPWPRCTVIWKRCRSKPANSPTPTGRFISMPPCATRDAWAGWSAICSNWPSLDAHAIQPHRECFAAAELLQDIAQNTRYPPVSAVFA